MIKVIYIQPDINETEDEICIHNIKISDKYKKIDTLYASSIAWLKNDSSRNYQNLELLFRSHELDTHVIAKKANSINDDIELTIPNNNLNLVPQYEMILSCRDKKDSYEELLTHHKNYDENFTALKYTGCYVDKNIKKEEDINNMNWKICNSKIKLDFEKFNGKDSINALIEDVILNHKQNPEKVVCGTISGNNLYGLSLNNKLISPIGWVEFEDKDYELVDFRTVKLNENK